MAKNGPKKMLTLNQSKFILSNFLKKKKKERKKIFQETIPNRYVQYKIKSLE